MEKCASEKCLLMQALATLTVMDVVSEHVPLLLRVVLSVRLQRNVVYLHYDWRHFVKG